MKSRKRQTSWRRGDRDVQVKTCLQAFPAAGPVYLTSMQETVAPFAPAWDGSASTVPTTPQDGRWGNRAHWSATLLGGNQQVKWQGADELKFEGPDRQPRWTSVYHVTSSTVRWARILAKRTMMASQRSLGPSAQANTCMVIYTRRAPNVSSAASHGGQDAICRRGSPCKQNSQPSLAPRLTTVQQRQGQLRHKNLTCACWFGTCWLGIWRRRKPFPCAWVQVDERGPTSDRSMGCARSHPEWRAGVGPHCPL